MFLGRFLGRRLLVDNGASDGVQGPERRALSKGPRAILSASLWLCIPQPGSDPGSFSFFQASAERTLPNRKFLSVPSLWFPPLSAGRRNPGTHRQASTGWAAVLSGAGWDQQQGPGKPAASRTGANEAPGRGAAREGRGGSPARARIYVARPGRDVVCERKMSHLPRCSGSRTAWRRSRR